MSNLSLKQIEQMSMYLSPKELEKALSDAINEQQSILEAEVEDLTMKPKETNLEDCLQNGGVTVIKYGGKKYRCSVLTVEMLQLYDNLGNLAEDGVEIKLPTIYKFHCYTALGSLFTVKCQDYTTAQKVVDNIFGKSLYSVSATKLR